MGMGGLPKKPNAPTAAEALTTMIASLGAHKKSNEL
jgi:hypothetical protein